MTMYVMCVTVCMKHCVRVCCVWFVGTILFPRFYSASPEGSYSLTCGHQHETLEVKIPYVLPSAVYHLMLMSVVDSVLSYYVSLTLIIIISLDNVVYYMCMCMDLRENINSSISHCTIPHKFATSK